MFGEIRTMTDERGETFFVGKDIAEALGYAKPQNALAIHVDDDDKTTALIQGTGSNYKTKVVIINESGLYALVLSSKLQQANAFKRWVTSEVLPQIRKTGAYVSQKKQIENLTRHIEELEPKAEYCDEVLERSRHVRDNLKRIEDNDFRGEHITRKTKNKDKESKNR